MTGLRRALLDELLRAVFEGADTPELTAEDRSWIEARSMAAMMCSLPDAAPDPPMRQAARRDLALTASLTFTARETQSLLRDADVDSVVVKGAAIAPLLPPVARRCSTDVDLLVSGGDYLHALDVLSSAGFRPHRDYWASRRMTAWATGSVNVARGAREQVDVHQFVGPPVLARRVSTDEVFARSVQRDGLRVAGVEDSIVQTCLSMIGDWGSAYDKAWPWFDLVALTRCCDVALLAEICERSELAWLVARVLSELPAGLVPNSVLSAMPARRPSPPDAVRLRTLTAPALRRNGVLSYSVRLGPTRGSAVVAMSAVRSLRSRKEPVR
jgi:hypothetical protein